MITVVEAWRGLAALIVVWAHWGPPLGWPMGPMGFAFTGVDLFFVLSGFVFAPALLGVTRTSLAPYVVRRVLRIYPAYLVALLIYIGLAWHAGKPLLYVPEHLLMAHMQSREMTFYYNPVFWSLPSEVTFYAFVPIVAWCLIRVGSSYWAALLGLAILIRLWLVTEADGIVQNSAYIALHHLPGLLVEFLLGVWVWTRAQRPLGRRAAVALGLGGVLGWLLLARLFLWLENRPSGPSWIHGQLGLVAAVCFAMVLLSSLQWPQPKPKSWTRVGAYWTGKLSYPLYLLHIAWLAPTQAWVREWGTVLGSAAGGLGLLASCWLLNVAVEDPARAWGRKLSARLTTKTHPR